MSVLYSPCSDLASAIRSLQHKVMSSDDDPVCLEVRRDCLLIDSQKSSKISSKRSILARRNSFTFGGNGVP